MLVCFFIFVFFSPLFNILLILCFVYFLLVCYILSHQHQIQVRHLIQIYTLLKLHAAISSFCLVSWVCNAQATRCPNTETAGARHKHWRLLCKFCFPRNGLLEVVSLEKIGWNYLETQQPWKLGVQTESKLDSHQQTRTNWDPALVATRGSAFNKSPVKDCCHALIILFFFQTN